MEQLYHKIEFRYFGEPFPKDGTAICCSPGKALREIFQHRAHWWWQMIEESVVDGHEFFVVLLPVGVTVDMIKSRMKREDLDFRVQPALYSEPLLLEECPFCNGTGTIDSRGPTHFCDKCYCGKRNQDDFAIIEKRILENKALSGDFGKYFS